MAKKPTVGQKWLDKNVELKVEDQVCIGKVNKVDEKNVYLTDLESGKRLVFSVEKVTTIKELDL